MHSRYRPLAALGLVLAAWLVLFAPERKRADPAAEAFGEGGIALRQRNAPLALSYFTEAIRMDPGFAKAYFERANLRRGLGDIDGCLADYDQVLRLNPDDVAAHNNRGAVRQTRRDYPGAISDFEAAIRLDPKHDKSYDGLAWLLATCPVDRYRNGQEAVKLATRACELSHGTNPQEIDTLAAAYAEAGDFDNAVKWQSRYLHFSVSPDDAEDGRQKLNLYWQHMPYHEQ